MSWSFSRALAVEFLEANSLDTEPSAPLNTTPMPDQFYWPDRTTEHSRLSRFGTTFEPFPENRGAELLMWFLGGFPVKRIHRRLLEKTMRTICGRKCGESWQMSLPGTYLPRTSVNALWKEPPKSSLQWVTFPNALKFQRLTWVRTTYGPDIGYLHTPTCTANYSAPSMQKHPSCRAFVRVFGKPTPANQEWLMGWPIGHTDLKPLETGKSPNAVQQLGESLREAETWK